MGHYASEMEGEDREKRSWRIREEKLYDKIKSIGLGCFKVNELPALLKLFRLGHLDFGANRDDIVLLEEAVARHEKLLALLPEKESKK